MAPHLGDDAGEQGVGRGRGHGMGRGQPVVQGVQTRLGPEAQQHQKRCSQQGRRERLEIAATDEGQGGLLGQQHHAEQGDEAAADGVVQVFYRAQQGLGPLGVQHQGEGQQGGELIKQVQGHQIRRQGRAQHRRLRQHQKCVETGMVPLVGHVDGA